MSVSGIGPSDTNYPTNIPTSGTPAFSFVMFYQLSEISGSLAASGTSSVSSTSSSFPSATLYADMQALTDLAKIHLYLLKGDTQDALAAANDFLSLQKQCSSTDPNISAVYKQATNYFQMSNGKVTGFQNDSGGKSFSIWWTQGTSANSDMAGAQYEINWLGSLPSQSAQLFPSTSSSSYTPGVFVDLCLMYADAMTVPSLAKAGIDTNFWGSNGQMSAFTFGQLFPYAAAAYAYQMTFNDPNGDKSWASFNNTMNSMLDLINTACKNVSGGSSPNFSNMASEFQDLVSQLKGGSSGAWPPSAPASGIDSNQWAILKHFLSSNDNDMGPFYQNVLADLYGQFMYGNP